MSKLFIKRKPAYFGAARKIKLWINDECVGKLAIGKEQSFELPPGEHQVKVSMDWCKSKACQITIIEQQSVKLEIETQFFLLAMLSTFFRPSALFTLQPA
ncbi:DUF2846 domain-containing protein [Kangiella shandongensis]|uniref:DUF2846 domain-containing protein n=1 Tax=Kangiella shandongensis TaxID=2763258 RepID=UPI001CBE9A9F|nr:DUF2846 domain-containing protein [Kangiella shandongensis]